MSVIDGINHRDLVYLSCPFGGDPLNLVRAIDYLAWAHTHTPWGLRVQAPWCASAMAESRRGTTERKWREMGGIDVEQQVLLGYKVLLHMGAPTVHECSPGMVREAQFMALHRKRVYQVIDRQIIETTGHWR